MKCKHCHNVMIDYNNYDAWFFCQNCNFGHSQNNVTYPNADFYTLFINNEKCTCLIDFSRNNTKVYNSFYTYFDENIILDVNPKNIKNKIETILNFS